MHEKVEDQLAELEGFVADAVVNSIHESIGELKKICDHSAAEFSIIDGLAMAIARMTCSYCGFGDQDEFYEDKLYSAITAAIYDTMAESHSDVI